MLPSLAYKDGKIENQVSPYQPPAEVKDLERVADIDLQTGDNILNRPFSEFNDLSLIQRANLDQKDWLAWSGSPSVDPDDSWMFTGTSAATRNKIIATAAHLTEQVVYPGVFAQDENNEDDNEAGEVMRMIVEYLCRNSNYEQTFLYGVISGLVNPVSYFCVDYARQWQEVLEGTQSAYTRKKVIDEIFSGFQYALLPLDEILIGNPYVFDIQKQPFIIHRRRISYTEAKAKYGNHPNFVHVRPGVISVQDASSGLFYDVEDSEYDNLVEEIIYSYRGQDRQFATVNRIYVSNPNVEYLPLRHRRLTKDGTDVPLYNIVKYGAEPIDAMRFWAYKSLAAKLANDKELVDRMRQNAVDAATFSAFPSGVTMGAGEVNRSIFIPATLTEIGKDAKVQPMTGMANPEPAWRAAQEAERAMSESSADSQFSGSRSGPETARGRMILQQNALTNLGVMGNMITQGMVKPIGELLIDDIIRYETVGEVQELVGGAVGMKYRTITLNEKVIQGKKKNVIIRFTDAWAGSKMSEQEIRDKKVKLFEEAGENREIHEVNPALFARRQYSIVVDPDALKPKNDPFERTFKTELYDRAINNPLIAGDPEKLADVTRDFLFEPTVRGESAKYIPKDTRKVLAGLVPPPQEGVTGKTVERNALQNQNLNLQI